MRRILAMAVVVMLAGCGGSDEAAPESPTKMPDVVGLTLPEAKAKLPGLDLTVADARDDRTVIVEANWVVETQDR